MGGLSCNQAHMLPASQKQPSTCRRWGKGILDPLPICARPTPRSSDWSTSSAQRGRLRSGGSPSARAGSRRSRGTRRGRGWRLCTQGATGRSARRARSPAAATSLGPTSQGAPPSPPNPPKSSEGGMWPRLPAEPLAWPGLLPQGSRRGAAARCGCAEGGVYCDWRLNFPPLSLPDGRPRIFVTGARSLRCLSWLFVQQPYSLVLYRRS